MLSPGQVGRDPRGGGILFLVGRDFRVCVAGRRTFWNTRRDSWRPGGPPTPGLHVVLAPQKNYTAPH